MRPMLAHRYAKHKHHLHYPLYVQPKLNGIRMLYQAGVLQSRSHGLDEVKTWPGHRLRLLRSSLERLPTNIILDGELYIHGTSLQRINGCAAVNRNEDTEATTQLEYHVFDNINTHMADATFATRHRQLLALQPFLGPAVKIVQTHFISSELEGDRLFSSYQQAGYEGLMYRTDESYGFVENCGNKENRWTRLLKRKDWLDAVCPIIGVTEGKGKYLGMVGALLCKFPDNDREFTVGSGLSDSERVQYLNNPPIGSYARVKYEMLSDEGVPLKPTLESIEEQ